MQKSLSHSPKVDVRISPKGKHLYFYRRDTNLHSKWEYIPRGQREYIKKLAQKKYNQAQLNNVRAELKIIDYYLKHYPNNTFDSFYQELHPDMKDLIIPLFKPFDLMIQQCLVPSEIFAHSNPERFSITNRNEIVRSKTEKIIADKLLELGIPYAYEPRINIGNGQFLYPDFVCANLVQKKIMYWEHLGAVDNPEYVERQFVKQAQYKKVGIVYGDNLFYTFETGTQILTKQNIMDVIEQFLLK